MLKWMRGEEWEEYFNCITAEWGNCATTKWELWIWMKWDGRKSATAGPLEGWVTLVQLEATLEIKIQTNYHIIVYNPRT